MELQMVFVLSCGGIIENEYSRRTEGTCLQGPGKADSLQMLSQGFFHHLSSAFCCLVNAVFGCSPSFFFFFFLFLLHFDDFSFSFFFVSL